MSISREDKLWAAAALAATAALHFHLFLAPRYAFGDDCLEYAVPYARFFLRELHHGRLALFNPYTDAGVSLFAQPPWMGPFYPLVVLFDLFSSGRALNAGFLFHTLLGVAGAYGLARTLGARPAASAAGAIAFGGSSAFANLFSNGYLPETVALSYLPVVWLFVERAYRSGKVVSPSHLAGALAVGLSLLGGHLTCNAVTWVAVPLYLGVRACVEALAERSARPLGRAAGALLVVFAGGVAVAAAQVFPMMEALAESSMAGGRAVNPDTFPWSEPWRILVYLFPSLGAGVKAHEYAGILTLALAPLAFARSRKGIPAAVAIVAVLASLLGMGTHTPLIPFLRDALPPFRIFSYFYFFHLPVVLSLCMLGALGLDALPDLWGRKRALWLSAGPLGLVALASLAAEPAVAKHPLLYGGTNPNLTSSLFQTIPVLVAAGALLLARRGSAKWSAALVPCLASLVLVDVSIYRMRVKAWQGERFDEGVFYDLSARSPVEPALASDSQRVFAAEEARPPVKWDFKRNRGFLAGYEEIRRSAKLPNARFADLSSKLDGITNDWVEELKIAEDPGANLAGRSVGFLERSRNLRILDLLGVGTVATRFPADGENLGDWQGPHLGVYWVRRSLAPRYYLTGRTRTARSPEEALDAVLEAGADPFQSVVVEDSFAVDEGAGPAGAVSVVSRVPGRIDLTADCPGPRFLVIGEIASSGWRVEVDGVKAKPVPANFAFFGVPLEAGEHHVRLRYEPRTFRLGVATSAAALAFIVVAGPILRRRRPR